MTGDIRVSREAAPPGPQITGFSGGRFVLGERIAEAGIILTPVAALDWTPPSAAATAIGDLAAAIAIDPAPEFILFGSGATLIRPPRSLTMALEARGIGIEPMDSRAAARAWTLLRSEGRWISAALMPL